MHSFVRISLCYIHQTRKMVDGKYTVPFFNEGEDEIKVSDLAVEWNVKSII